MAGTTCALSGCNKPPWPPAGGTTPHLTCGNLHHQLLMASRFNPTRPSPYIAILNRNTARLCALLSCKNPPYPGHSWCSRSHYLLWLAEFTASLQPDQICKLRPHCIRHVFVDENASPSEFCGWEHQQKFVMLSALNQRHQQEALPAMDAHPQQPPSPPPSFESVCGLVPSLNSCMDALKQFALSRIRPKNIRVVEDFYEKHPWEIFTEGHACVLIAGLKFTSKGRQLTTKGHYHWKQSGPRAKKSKLFTAKYYTYMKRKGKEKEGDDEQHAESLYTMKEYTMEGVKWYSLIERVKEKPSSHAKPHKEQPTQQHQVVKVNNACSQDLWNDDMDLWIDDISSEDSIFRELSPLTHHEWSSSL